MAPSSQVNNIATLLQPATSPPSTEVSAADREHAVTVVAHELHRDCPQWSWTEHRAEVHTAEARKLVGALCREGWGPLARLLQEAGPAA